MKEVIEKTAEELGVSEELVEAVVRDLFGALREYFRDLHTMRRGILLPYLRFEVRAGVIAAHLRKLHVKEGRTEAEEAKMEYLGGILDNMPWSDKIYKHKKQKYAYDTKRIFDSQGEEEVEGGQAG